MKRFFLLLVVLGLSQSAVFGGLLVNGDAESGDFTGWDISGESILQNVVSRQESAGVVYPAESDRFFSFARVRGTYAMMSQTGLVDTGVGALTLGGFFQGEYSDYGVVTLNIYDEAGSELLSESSGEITTANLVWETFQIDATLPHDAYSWEVTLEGFLDYGSYVNVFYDGVYLIPEPTTILLLGLGGLALKKRRYA